MSEEDVEYEDVLKRLKSLEMDKACGPDQIVCMVLKEYAESVALTVTLIFKESIKSGELPSQLLRANVSPLYKKGEKTVPANYRPVSLTSVLCKILEGIVRSKLEKYFYEYNLVTENQHGFVRGKSCTTNLLKNLGFISGSLSSGYPVDVIYLDFAKAFDPSSQTSFETRTIRC